MLEKFSISTLFIWLFVIVLGLVLGAGLYETIVILPTWTSAPPTSVLEYYRHNVEFPQFAVTAGPRLWIFLTPLLGLVSIATITTAFGTRPEHRKWRLIAAGLALLVVLCTFIWFVPNLLSLIGDTVTTMSNDKITSVTNWWVRLNWVRVVVYSIAWLAGLRALAISGLPTNAVLK